MCHSDDSLKSLLECTSRTLEDVLDRQKPFLSVQEYGTVRSIAQSIASVDGMPGVQSEELVLFPGNTLGLVLNIDPHEVGVVCLDAGEHIKAATEVYRTGRVLDVPVGEELLGRIVDPLGRPLDHGGPLHTAERRIVERDAPAIMDRDPVKVPLQTGIKVIDALIPIGRGQRELILGDRQTGKTAVALDTIINQVGKNILCVYCAIGQRGSSVAKVVADLKRHGAMSFCIVVVAEGDDTPGLQFVAPYAATSMAEFFMESGRDVLIVYDDLTRHAVAYRELSLLLRRPPGREAFPGDIFYIHSRLLERSTHLCGALGGGSLTALPIIETEAENMSAYIPTNLISITDGQVYLSPLMFQKGILPDVDVGKSVSRVGGKTQLSAYRAVAGDLRLTYAQFEELETFSRFGTRLDEATRQTLERGRRVRESLKQRQFDPMPVPEQIAVLLAVSSGLFDSLDIEAIPAAEEAVRRAVRHGPETLLERIDAGASFEDADRDALLSLAQEALSPLTGEADHGNP
jgi:F-type H+-transporting ATPase subunit alpha